MSIFDDAINQSMNDRMRQDLIRWAAGKESLLNQMNLALDSLIYLSDNEHRLKEYDQMMTDDWLDAFLIIHYHALAATGGISKLEIGRDHRDNNREVRAVISSTDDEVNGNGYDLFLVDPHDIRMIAKNAMLIAMYYMDERTKVERLLASEE
tara:strand:+ start:81 stop:536 length:456 start_codon:yes stop_codon:yes gene_type:complete